MALLVQRAMCASCIYRPDTPLNLKELEAEIADPRMDGHFVGHRICHHSGTAVCAGFWRRHRDHFTLGQLAQRLQLVEFVEHDREV